VFLDELLNANSAILNSLLTALNERVVHRGQERIRVQALMFVGASNHLPEDDALNALFDRFLLRVHCDNVPDDRLGQVLEAGWRLEAESAPEATLGFADIAAAQQSLGNVVLDAVRPAYLSLVFRIRQAGLRLSDRRAVKLQRLIAASALLCGRMQAQVSDLWVLRYIWDADDQQEVLNSLVRAALAETTGEEAVHPRARNEDRPDPESLARDLTWIEEHLQKPEGEVDRAVLRDRLSILDGRIQWVPESMGMQREHLIGRVKSLWEQLSESKTA
jgi:MoxR-like ATPase